MQLATNNIIAREILFLLGVGIIFLVCLLVGYYVPSATNSFELESDRFFIAFQRQEIANRIRQPRQMKGLKHIRNQKSMKVSLKELRREWKQISEEL